MSTTLRIIDGQTVRRLAPSTDLIDWMREAMVRVGRGEAATQPGRSVAFEADVQCRTRPVVRRASVALVAREREGEAGDLDLPHAHPGAGLHAELDQTAVRRRGSVPDRRSRRSPTRFAPNCRRRPDPETEFQRIRGVRLTSFRRCVALAGSERPRRGDRVAEGTRLLSGRSSKGYRGFESLPLRK